MKNNILIYAVLFTALFTVSELNGQTSQKVKDLIQVQDSQYFADRDSAYLDPYYGIKKLFIGNKRFAENKSVNPR